MIAGIGLASGLARYWIIRHANDGAPLEVDGVTLGMTPSDVRDRFRAPSQGTWQSEMRGDPALIWTSSTPSNGAGSNMRQDTATFEFHSGVLVAVRLVVPSSDRAAQGPSFESSTAWVLVRRVQGDGRVEITLLARDCPTHAEEVQRLIRSH